MGGWVGGGDAGGWNELLWVVYRWVVEEMGRFLWPHALASLSLGFRVRRRRNVWVGGWVGRKRKRRRGGRRGELLTLGRGKEGGGDVHPIRSRVVAGGTDETKGVPLPPCTDVIHCGDDCACVLGGWWVGGLMGR